jgi:phosphonate transport system substrate-binding protein
MELTRTSFKRVVFFIVSLLFFLNSVVSAEIRFAVLPRLRPSELYVMFKPLQEYLSQETGETVSLVITKDFDDFKRAIKAGQVDLAFSNPLIYVQLKKALDLKPLALSSEFKAGTRYRGILIARKDSAINTLADLKGKKIAFVDQDSLGGYVMQMLMFHNAGMDIHKDITVLPFAKKHNNVAHLVFIKKADAGGIREDDFERMKDGLVIDQIKIVAYTDYVLNWPIYAAPRLQQRKADKIRDALLRLSPTSSRSKKILNKASLEGFVPVKDEDYDGLRKAAKIVGAY